MPIPAKRKAGSSAPISLCRTAWSLAGLLTRGPSGIGSAGLLAAKVLGDKGKPDQAKAALAWVAEQSSDEGYQATASHDDEHYGKQRAAPFGVVRV